MNSSARDNGAVPPTRTDVALRAKQVDVYLMASRIVRTIDQRVTDKLAAHGLDVTSAQVNLLVVLIQAQRPLSGAELARAMALSEVTVGRLVRTLAERGWVTRDPDPSDRRAWKVTPTQRTYDEFPRFIDIVNGLSEEAWVGIDEEDIAVTLETERRVWDNLSAERDRD